MTAVATALLAQLRSLRNEANIAGMRRFGITSRHEQLGISVGVLRKIARSHRCNHELALELWGSGVFEAMLLAAIIDDPRQITPGQMERWAREADNWALTDMVGSVFDRTAWAEGKASAWSRRRAEFVKRAGFSMMAEMAVHRKDLPDEVFLKFLPLIERESTDPRNFVKKAVNWALRQIGKRNARLHRAALDAARRIARIDDAAARWIARDALRELKNKKPGAKPGAPT